MDKNYIYNKLCNILTPSQIFMDEPMKKHTSFKIGGSADILLMPSSIQQIKDVLVFCRELSIPIFIMGNGSNLLVRDKGIRGVVIKISDKFNNSWVDGNNIKAQAGILLSVLSRIALRESLTGLEFASGIPGTLGGAVAMNAGAYGGEMKNVVKNVTAIDRSGNIYDLDNEKLKFGYRTSFIQEAELIVLEVDLELKPGNREEIKSTIADLTRRRQEKQPLTYPSAGSTFKRPTGYYAGRLIEDAGLKGYRVGDAQVSELHAGFIINTGNATAEDVIQLIQIIRNRIKEKFDVDIYPEVKIIGEE